MKETLSVFVSVVAILLGMILLYANAISGSFLETGYLVGDGFGILFLAGGLTGIWATRRFKRSP